jgi:hypothetical protein
MVEKLSLLKEQKRIHRLESGYWINLLGRLQLEKDIKNASTIIDLGCGPFGLYLLQMKTEDDTNYFKVNEFIAVDPLIDEYVTSLDFFDKQDYPKCKFVASSIEQFQTQKI